MSKVDFWLQLLGEARKPLSARVEERLQEKRKNKDECIDLNEMTKAVKISTEADKKDVSVLIDVENKS